MRNRFESAHLPIAGAAPITLGVNRRQQNCHPLRGLLFGLALIISIPQIAFAGDWRYCLAPSHAEHKIYMTEPFPEALTMGDAETQFRRRLSLSGLTYDVVQCPRSDDESEALAMQQDAIDFNRKLGNQIITMNWKPGR